MKPLAIPVSSIGIFPVLAETVCRLPDVQRPDGLSLVKDSRRERALCTHTSTTMSSSDVYDTTMQSHMVAALQGDCAAATETLNDHCVALYNSTEQQHPTQALKVTSEQMWHGGRETLTAWFSELDSTIAFCSPTLHELAIEG